VLFLACVCVGAWGVVLCRCVCVLTRVYPDDLYTHVSHITQAHAVTHRKLVESNHVGPAHSFVVPRRLVRFRGHAL